MSATLCVAHESVKVQSRRKYVFTDQIDQLIRAVYLNHRDAKTRPGIRPLAKKVGMPRWALKKRARELGLARTKELPWSGAELGILARYAWMSDERIRLKLKAAGYSRTVTGIHLKLKRMRFKHDGSFYSAYSLAQALGDRPSHRKRPQFLDEPVVQLPGPFAREKSNDFGPSVDELRAVPPSRVDRVCQSYFPRVPTIPAIFRRRTF